MYFPWFQLFVATFFKTFNNKIWLKSIISRNSLICIFNATSCHGPCMSKLSFENQNVFQLYMSWFYNMFSFKDFFKFWENGIVYLKRLIKGALSGLRQFLVTESPLKRMKNNLKSSFCSQDIKVFVLNFCSCGKTTWLER